MEVIKRKCFCFFKHPFLLLFTLDLDDGGIQLTIQRLQSGDVSSPKVGKIDPNNDPHVGGNQWAGGTGGRDTAGLGGKGGPYRLDAGHAVHQVESDFATVKQSRFCNWFAVFGGF